MMCKSWEWSTKTKPAAGEKIVKISARKHPRDKEMLAVQSICKREYEGHEVIEKIWTIRL